MAKEKVAKPIELTENTKKVLAWMQANNKGAENGYKGSEIAAGVGVDPKGIFGTMEGLYKKGFVGKGSVTGTVQKFDVNTGAPKMIEKTYTTYYVTEAGAAFQC